MPDAELEVVSVLSLGDEVHVVARHLGQGELEVGEGWLLGGVPIEAGTVEPCTLEGQEEVLEGLHVFVLRRAADSCMLEVGMRVWLSNPAEPEPEVPSPPG